MLPIAPSLEALLGEPVEQMVELGSPWATSTQTELATLASGRQVVVQRPRGDASAQLTIRRRLCLGRLLPTVAPWLPVPDVLAGVAAGPQPFLVTRLEKTGIAAWWKLPFPLRGAAYALCFLILLVFGGATQKFIYFDF